MSQSDDREFSRQSGGSPASRRNRAAESLRALIEGHEPASEGEPIPGSENSLYPPAPPGPPSPSDLARELQALASAQGSALAKSRALLVASQLFAHEGSSSEAFETALVAAETSPKMGLAAVSLRRKAKVVRAFEAASRVLEATARQATHTSTRTHAIRLLVEGLLTEGKSAEAGLLLDQAARTGDADDALHLERLVHRLAQGASLAGIEIPEQLRGAARTAVEILSGAPKPSKDSALTPRELRPLQAARQLRANNPHETRAWLDGLEIPEHALEELYSCLLAAEPREREGAKGVLRELLKTAPSARVMRQLARLALEYGDRTTLRTVLDRADPGSGTFSLKERWLLAACAGQPLEISRDEMIALLGENEALALALGPTDLITPVVESASTAALLAQIGASLTRLRQPTAPHPLAESGREALRELAHRGVEPEATSVLSLLLAAGTSNEVSFGQALLVLADEPNRAGGALIAGALLQKAESREHAEQAYRLALLGDKQLATSARRGLFELGVADRDAQLAAWAEGAQDPKLLFARQLLGAFDLPLEQAVQKYLEVVRIALSDEAAGLLRAAERESSGPALLFALGSVGEALGLRSLSEHPWRELEHYESDLSRLVRLNRTWEGRDALPTEGTRKYTDPAERALAYVSQSGLSEFRAPTRDTAPDGTPLASASEILLHLAKSIAFSELEGSAYLGSLCTEVDRAAGEIGIDTQRLAGKAREIAPLWLERARSAELPEARRFAYERLAELDEHSGDRASALLWQKAIAEEFPSSVPALLRLEETLLSQGLSTFAATEKLSQALPEADAKPYQLLFFAQALADSDLRAARKYLEPLLADKPAPLLVLRGVITLAHEKREDALLLQAYEQLAELPGTDLDRSARAHSFALLLARLGRAHDAVLWARRAITEKPRAFSAHQLLNFLSTPDDPFERATQLEAFGHASAEPEHRSDLFFEAGNAFDLAEDPERAADCYAETLRATPNHRDAFSLLCERREAQGNLEAVVNLILERLTLIGVGSTEHLELELKLAALLSTLDRPEEAKKHLEAALAVHPTHSGALRAHADVSAALGAHEAALRSLLALRDRLSKGDERTAVMRSLAHLYDEHLGQLEKAMDAYQAVLTEAPDDEKTQNDLVRIYSQLGLAERATALQTRIIQEANSAEKKRDGALVLAQIYETIAGDPKRAGATLERTRKAWPLDAAVLEATVLFMDRQGSGGPRGFLLDRAGKDARRKLETGRLDAGLLDTLARVARLSDHKEQSKMTEAARHAYLGSTPSEPISGAGLFALSPKVDDIIAPTGLSAPLRALLRKTGAAMDAAFSVDMAQMGARPLSSGRTFERMEQIAKALDSDAPQLFVSDRLGAKCLPITTEPARLLIGADVDEIPDAERDYLLLRALKLRWLGAGALARSKDEDRFPLLVALLHLFAPNWRPMNVDGRKTAQAKALLEAGLARVGYDDDVPMLALEVIGALGNQGSTVADQTRILANRVALLGMGDPRIPISAMALTEGTKLASGGPSRFRFIESHPEAKDLLLFATSEKCAEARRALGLEKDPRSADAPLGSEPSTPGLHPPLRDGAPAPPRRPKPPPPKRS